MKSNTKARYPCYWGKGLIIIQQGSKFFCCQQTVDSPPNVVPAWCWMVDRQYHNEFTQFVRTKQCSPTTTNRSVKVLIPSSEFSWQIGLCYRTRMGQNPWYHIWEINILCRHIHGTILISYFMFTIDPFSSGLGQTWVTILWGPNHPLPGNCHFWSNLCWYRRFVGEIPCLLG